MSRPMVQPGPAAGEPPARADTALSSSDAADRLNRALAELTTQRVIPLLQAALEHVRVDRHREAAELALKALNIDQGCAAGWHMLAVCREKDGDFTNSLKCYDRAFQLDPEDEDIAYNLGHLAFRMGMPEVAEQLFRHFLARRPESLDGANNLACALREQMRFAEAVEVIRTAITLRPDYPLAWNTLATIQAGQGDLDRALVFFDEALRLDPGFAKARYNRANARLHLGDAAGALADCEAAMGGVALEGEAVTMKFARSTMLLAAGELGPGWDAYEVRFDPHHSDALYFLIDRPLWSPESALEGRSLLLSGEQGLGDEVMFANVVPNVIEALGPRGALTLAVEPRLIPLFRRSFPTARVCAHGSARAEHRSVRTLPEIGDPEAIDLWAPLASTLRRFRRTLADFPATSGYLKADPARIAHWRGELAALGPGPKVGLVWKSLKMNAERVRYYSPFEHWRAVLQTPGACFVNLQYGDYAAELAHAREAFGVEVWSPPGLDLKDDLDEVAALSSALDVVIGPPNAATNIAAACGAPVWFIVAKGAWPRCGSDGYPWYPQARAFTPSAMNAWAPVMADIAEALARLA